MTMAAMIRQQRSNNHNRHYYRIGLPLVFIVSCFGLFHYYSTVKVPYAFDLFEKEPRAVVVLHPHKEKRVYPATAFQNLVLQESDSIYQYGTWDEAPIVVESHKLLFFTTPKVGCTIFKQLFRRIYGHADWNNHNDIVPHMPVSNGLYYLYNYPPHEANYMMTDPSWTRAIFVRHPKERILSAYLDKGFEQEGQYLQNHCCAYKSLYNLLKCDTQKQSKTRRAALVSFEDFVHKVYPTCRDPHWAPQAERMDHKYWKYINFVGHMERIQQDTKSLLQRIGAWNDYGATGWSDGSIFQGRVTVEHATHSKHKYQQYYNAALEKAVEQIYQADYQLDIFNLTRRH